jgi:lysine-N-methylase
VDKKFKILKPQYFDAFRCRGEGCASNCCRRDWRIDVDKIGYYKLKSLPGTAWQKKFAQNIIPNKKPQMADDDYAQIDNKKGGCPFLDGGLCSIELAWGKDYLPLVCHTYPRIYNIVDGIPEKALALSCPEAAKLILSDPNTLKFVQQEEEFYLFNIISNTLDTEQNNAFHKEQRYFAHLRFFLITLLQNRTYALWERLAIMGSFFYSLPSYGVPENIAAYKNRLQRHDFTHFLSSIPKHIELKTEIIKRLLAMPNPLAESVFIECMAEFECGFDVKGGLNTEEIEISLRYADTYYNYYLPFLSANAHILEHYLVNHVFTTLFPFNEDRGLFTNYTYLAIHYALIKILLIGTASFQREKFNAASAIKLLSAFTHELEQDSFHLDWIINFLNDQNLNSLDNLLLLMKN